MIGWDPFFSLAVATKYLYLFQMDLKNRFLNCQRKSMPDIKKITREKGEEKLKTTPLDPLHKCTVLTNYQNIGITIKVKMCSGLFRTLSSFCHTVIK